MAFKEAGGSPAISSDPETPKNLKLRWEYLKSDCCPSCGDPMALFEHLKCWKCACGFKISCYRKQELEGDMELEPTFRGRTSGYGYRKYGDDEPF